MVDEKKVVDLNAEPMPEVDRTPVNPEVPPATEPPPTVEPAVTPDASPAPEVTPTPELTPPEPVDEFGRPYKQRLAEAQRKYEELAERLPQIIDEKLSKLTQPQTPQYTYEQLEVYKQQNQSDPNIVAWVVGEQRKIQQQEQRKLIEEVVGSREQVTRIENMKQKSLEYVQKEYPMAFKKDANGNPIAWDESHPITQQIFGLMRNPQLANNPEGLMAAADIAYGRFAKSQTPALQKSVAKAKADVKQAQKASLTEGGGRKVTTSVAPHTAAIEQVKKTGSLRDAEAAVGAILRSRGLLE